MKCFFTFILINFSLPLFSQSTEFINYSADFKILTTSLKELSPILFRKNGEDFINKEIDITNSKILSSQSKEEVILHIQKFLFLIGDGHIYNSSIYDLNTINKALPFDVFIHEEKLYIKNFPNHPEINGQEIKTLNSLTSKTIIDSLGVFFTNDGGRKLLPFQFQIFFNSLYSRFISKSDSIYIQTNDQSYRFKMLQREDTLFKNLITNQFDNYLGKDKFLKFYHNTLYSYFYFLGFQKKLGNHKLMKEFKTFIKTINEYKTPNLIIDLRFNAGGDPGLAAKMCRYLCKVNFRTYENSYLTNVKKPTFLKFMENKKMYFFRNFGVIPTGNLRKRFVFDRDLTIKNKPKKNIYNGQIYIITGTMTHSSATMFCHYLSDQGNVKIIGSETTGAINYLCAGTHCDISLPNLKTNYSFGLDLIELIKDSYKKEIEKPLIPAIEIKYTSRDIIENKDLEMLWILNHLSK